MELYYIVVVGGGEMVVGKPHYLSITDYLLRRMFLLFLTIVMSIIYLFTTRHQPCQIVGLFLGVAGAKC